MQLFFPYFKIKYISIGSLNLKKYQFRTWVFCAIGQFNTVLSDFNLKLIFQIASLASKYEPFYFNSTPDHAV